MSQHFCKPLYILKTSLSPRDLSTFTYPLASLELHAHFQLAKDVHKIKGRHLFRDHSSITSSKVGGWGDQMMMFDDKVGGWGWLNADVIKKYTREKKLCLRAQKNTYLKSVYPFEDITDQ